MAVHDMLMAAAGGTAGAVNWIDDVFSTYLYTGNSSTQTITNGIDLSTKGGLVWTKSRSASAPGPNNTVIDTVRGINSSLYTNLNWYPNAGDGTNYSDITSWNANGFSLGYVTGDSNSSGVSYASWTFRKQAKFFDVVTYTGNGLGGKVISHSLGSAPGCIIVKRTDTTGNWAVYHRSTGNTGGLRLNTTDAFAAYGSYWYNTTPTATDFTVGNNTDVNANGGTYVAYLFAHDAGGFGTAGTDNVISCGSFTTDSSGNADINLGYEPQWILFKRNFSGANWQIFDNMRGMPVTGNAPALFPNLADADTTQSSVPRPNATGFSTSAWSANATYIYIAIRRPMKPPTSGTSVFNATAVTPTSGQSLSVGFPVDMGIARLRNLTTEPTFLNDRLRGVPRTNTYTGNQVLDTTSTAAETGGGPYSYGWDSNTSIKAGSYLANYPTIYWNFKRAPGFFDVVCYTGDGSASKTINHNLGVAPELIISKARNNTLMWSVYVAPLGVSKGLVLNTNAAQVSTSNWVSAPTSTVFYVGNTDSNVRPNVSGDNDVAYLFATVAGVSKVGSYTGTGTTNQINCGFSGGARFVLIKRTDSTGDWYIWDTARGIVSGNDPYLLLNSTAAEVTSTDYIDPYSAGFELSSTAPAAINANGGSYIYLAIA